MLQGITKDSKLYKICWVPTFSHYIKSVTKGFGPSLERLHQSDAQNAPQQLCEFQIPASLFSGFEGLSWFMLILKKGSLTTYKWGRVLFRCFFVKMHKLHRGLGSEFGPNFEPCTVIFYHIPRAPKLAIF